MCIFSCDDHSCRNEDASAFRVVFQDPWIRCLSHCWAASVDPHPWIQRSIHCSCSASAKNGLPCCRILDSIWAQWCGVHPVGSCTICTFSSGGFKHRKAVIPPRCFCARTRNTKTLVSWGIESRWKSKQSDRDWMINWGSRFGFTDLLGLPVRPCPPQQVSSSARSCHMICLSLWAPRPQEAMKQWKNISSLEFSVLLNILNGCLTTNI